MEDKKQKPFILTEESYFSREASEIFFGHSELVSALKCHAAALDETLNGAGEDKKCFSEGSYFDALICGEQEAFEAEHPEIFQRDGKTLRADYVRLRAARDRVMQDEIMAKYTSGEHQTIYTGYITGAYSGKQYPVKVKPDGLIMDDETGKPKLIVDYKCLKDLKPMYSERLGDKTHPALAWRYDVQAWMYRKIIAEHYGMEPESLPFVLLIATKEVPCNLALLQFHESDIQAAGDEIEHMIDAYAADKKQFIKTGKLPAGCGRDDCVTCRTRKKIKGIDWIE